MKSISNLNPISSGGEIYSTDEQVIGKWIDNNTLYKKTIIIRQNNVDLYSYTDYPSDRAKVYQTCLPDNIDFISISQIYIDRADSTYVDVLPNNDEIIIVPNPGTRNIYLAASYHNPQNIIITIKYTYKVI